MGVRTTQTYSAYRRYSLCIVCTAVIVDIDIARVDIITSTAARCLYSVDCI